MQTSCLVNNQSFNLRNGAAKPSCEGKSGCVLFEFFLALQSSKLHVREWSAMASAKVIRLFEGVRDVLIGTNSFL